MIFQETCRTFSLLSSPSHFLSLYIREGTKVSESTKSKEESKIKLTNANVFDPFSLDVWDPFEGFLTPSELANAPAKDMAAFTNAKVDLRETPEAHVFKADLPGLKKEEVKVEAEDGNILQISGERSSENEEKSDKWHRVERSSGKFMRRFRLPENAKMEEVKASMENGVLSVTVPKVPEKKPEVKSIDISG